MGNNNEGKRSDDENNGRPLVDSTSCYMNLLALRSSALSFRLLLPGKPDFVWFNGLQSVYLMLMGSNDVEIMNADGVLPADQVALTTSVGKVFSNLVELILCIVLMNALIAIMGDSYAVITEDRKNRGLQSKAQVVVEMMQLYLSLIHI